jgi:hypothetical protein
LPAGYSPFRSSNPKKSSEQHSNGFSFTFILALFLSKIIMSMKARIIDNLLAQVDVLKAANRQLQGGGRRVLIIGAGMGGLATALVLHRAGYDVSVFERSVEPGEVGAGINITPAGKKFEDIYVVLTSFASFRCQCPQLLRIGGRFGCYGKRRRCTHQSAPVLHQ